jgi:hypothetical protein
MIFSVYVNINIELDNIAKITGYFTSNNESDGIENATHNTFPKKTGY